MIKLIADLLVAGSLASCAYGPCGAYSQSDSQQTAANQQTVSGQQPQTTSGAGAMLLIVGSAAEYAACQLTS